MSISGAVLAAVVGAVAERFRSNWSNAYDTIKRYMGRGLLIGLDLLIAGDVIKTVTLEPTLNNAAVLGLLVLIRTFLSWTTILVVEGRWPWQPKPLRLPKLFNLRTDPFERADITSNTYFDWMLDHAFLFVPAQAFVAEHLQTFVEFLPRQEPASFSIDKVLEKLQAGITSS